MSNHQDLHQPQIHHTSLYMITLLSILLALGCETPTLSGVLHQDPSVESMDGVDSPLSEPDHGLIIDDPMESGGEAYHNQDEAGDLSDHDDHFGDDTGDADDDLRVNDRGDNLEVRDSE